MEDQLPKPPINVLLVENDSLMAINLKKHLSREDRQFQFFQVRDGVEALDFLKNRESYQNAPKPELVILNVNLPIIDGYQVLQVIKETDGLKGVPTIVIGDEVQGEKRRKWVHSSNAEEFTSTVDSVRHFLVGALKGPS